MMKHIIILILPSLIHLGCSSLSGTIEPDIKSVTANLHQGDNHWNWGIWQFALSVDHTQVEVVPQRHAQYHYCVTKFMEIWPCSNCLEIEAPEVQPDETVKLNVTLRHPFPSVPKYTGFDVRGMVYFPPTKIQPLNAFHLNYDSRIDDSGSIFPAPYYNHMPIIFSCSEQGGGEVLNADGYSCYLIPGLIYSDDWPIFSYSEPKYNIKPTPELTTINPYKLFCSDLPRRMFRVTDEITREYHINLPPGPFTFGYAVDASWWPPTKVPVTDPAIDFPPEANAEDPWLIEYEQLLPICEENVDKNIFKVIIHHRGYNQNWWAGIWGWDVTLGGHDPQWPLFTPSEQVIIDDYTTVKYGKLSYVWWYLYGKDGLAVHGEHMGVLVVISSEVEPPWTTELEHVFGPRFVDIYVEG